MRRGSREGGNLVSAREENIFNLYTHSCSFTLAICDDDVDDEKMCNKERDNVNLSRLSA